MDFVPSTYAISYLRYSSRKQSKNSSYARQLADTESYCKEQGLTLVERLEDLGISAWDGSNLDDTAALGGLLQRLDTGKVPRGSVLICENLDRLSRANILDALQLFIGILKKGIDIVTTMDGMRYSEQSVRENISQLIISITILARGSNESEVKSNRVRQYHVIRRQKIRNGQFSKFACPSWITHDGNAWKLIESNAKTVKLIFELYCAGHGAYSLVKELNRRGIKPFTKTGRWTAIFIHELITNPAAIGTFALLEPPVKNYYPAAVDENLYYRAQGIRESNRKHAGRRGTKEINLFGGLLKCHRCGSSYVKYQCRNRDGTQYRALVCSGAKVGKCKYEFLNWNVFVWSFDQIFCSQEFGKFIMQLGSELRPDNSDAIQGKLVEVNANIRRVAGILARTDSTELETQLSLLEDERKLLDKQLTAELVRVNSQTNPDKQWAKFVNQIGDDYDKPEFRLQLRAFMRKAISKIICKSTGYIVYFHQTNDSLAVEVSRDGYSVDYGGGVVLGATYAELNEWLS
jgi:DNA invertase Pin-like site-specific DNA recombinase